MDFEDLPRKLQKKILKRKKKRDELRMQRKFKIDWTKSDDVILERYREVFPALLGFCMLESCHLFCTWCDLLTRVFDLTLRPGLAFRGLFPTGFIVRLIRTELVLQILYLFRALFSVIVAYRPTGLSLVVELFP